MSTESLVRNLAIAATVLGVTAAVAGSPYASQHATVDVDLLSRAVVNEDDHVSAVELARWIRERRPGLRAVDVRPRADYDAYHIPTAEWISLDSIGRGDFRPSDTIVLYSEGGAHAAQGWVFLRALRFERVYFLRGGVLDWLEDVMNPTLTINAPKADSAAFDVAAPLSRYFGGVPRSGVAADATDNIVLPPRSAGGSGAVLKKMRRRGC